LISSRIRTGVKSLTIMIIITIIIIMLIITTIRKIPDLNSLFRKARMTMTVCSATSKERCRQTFPFTKKKEKELEDR